MLVFHSFQVENGAAKLNIPLASLRSLEGVRQKWSLIDKPCERAARGAKYATQHDRFMGLPTKRAETTSK